MAYNVFLSHSMTAEDQHVVAVIQQQLAAFGVGCYVAERDWQFGASLAQKVENAIRASDCLVALLTRGGSASSYVNQEIGLAHGAGKLIIPIVEDGVALTGFKTGVEWLDFDRANPHDMVAKLTPRVVALAEKKKINTGLGLAILAALAFWAGK